MRNMNGYFIKLHDGNAPHFIYYLCAIDKIPKSYVKFIYLRDYM